MKIVQNLYFKLSGNQKLWHGCQGNILFGAVEQLLNDIGKQLKPVVRAIITTKNIGAGILDGGLFTKEQFNKWGDNILDFVGTLPARGVIEIKGASESIENIGKSKQVENTLKGMVRFWSLTISIFCLLVKTKKEMSNF